MQVIVKNGVYKGSHITGPTHNFLDVKFGTNENHKSFVIEVLPPIAGCTHGPGLTADEVRPWIDDGLSAAMQEIGQRFQIERVEVVENDNRRPEIYRELARRIVLRFHENQSDK